MSWSNATGVKWTFRKRADQKKKYIYWNFSLVYCDNIITPTSGSVNHRKESGPWSVYRLGSKQNDYEIEILLPTVAEVPQSRAVYGPVQVPLLFRWYQRLSIRAFSNGSLKANLHLHHGPTLRMRGFIPPTIIYTQTYVSTIYLF